MTSSRPCSYETGPDSLASLLGTFCFIALALRDLLSSGLTVAPQTDTACPAAKMFILAFMSLSWWLPHSGQSHSLIFKGNFSTTWPQLEQRLELGKYLSIFINVRPYHSALYFNCLTNSPHIASLITLANLWFLTMFFMSKSSTTIVWFSLISRVVSC